ncbi:S-adenosyl-L-methionine-dependent methyltransferase [Hyaloscypha bicolor E]|uniref:S-adenosyl-L-methionine-dependent methyltransferase n=1 Tax=Hyaloscypha bicolor E TaxID=1095630 RepID=A0A2J6SEZ3_9HELO|nr:S-adenosyl-L-methionine-dependent methyltransferase [Hyaloscypha bicolor E]PMD49341.1 S-adenosyl-L-methionine-dependent methyltransferase [Hyaloscypha bicolor E]
MHGGFNDNDSTYGGSLIGCDSDTLASYITDYRYENGRRYHAYRGGEYWGPNDEYSNDLQDLAHHMYLMTLEGKLHLAPLDNPHNILDIGTGTGIWAIEMADAYPSAHVIGTDLSPIQPLFVPPNCAFEIEDLNLDWTYSKSQFDFIHIRELFGSVADWDEFFSSAFEHTKPGGYVEVIEHSVFPVSDDGTVNEESFFTLWGKTVVEMGRRFGKSFTIWEESRERLERAGFVDIVEKKYKWPVNGWPSPEYRTHGDDGEKSWQRLREIGVWNQLRLYDGVEGFMLRLLTVAGGWTYDNAQAFLARMREEIKDLKIHAYLNVTVVYGRKPGGKARAGDQLPHPATRSGYVSPEGGWRSTIPEDYQGLP